VQNRVIALTRGEFEDGGNIRRFKQLSMASKIRA
jgi:hypothetical protein